MIERLKVKGGVLALQVRGHLSRDDVDQCVELLAEELEDRTTIDLFIEVVGLTGFDTEALAVGFERGSALLRQLDRFGRVAIVSDQAWIRWASRVESAILPGISYRVYTPAERQAALAWVQRVTDLPYGNAVRLIPTTRADTIALEINGRLAAEEVSQVVRDLNEMRRGKALKAILVLLRSLPGFDPSIVADGEYLRMKLALPSELDRYAVVGGPHWLEAWLKFWQPLVRVELQHFGKNEEDAAWRWIGAKPLAEKPVAA